MRKKPRGNGRSQEASPGRILVVDDDASLLVLFRTTLERAGYTVFEAQTHRECYRILDEQGPLDAVLLDVVLPEVSGIDILAEVMKRPNPPAAVMITGSKSVEHAVTALKLGAYDYLTKPSDTNNTDKFLNVMSHAVTATKAQRKIDALESALIEQHSMENIVGQSAAMRAVFTAVRQVSQSDVTVLVHGASGTGKELVARAIHFHSPRRSGPFVPVNCAAIPESLIESELFGHEKGSFTGATGQKKGKFEVAAGGSIFLDEIGDMDHGSQAKLLRVLQDKTFERVGGTASLTADVRVIVATNKDLEKLVAEERFREDLYYRLNVFPIELPPLSERPDDVPLLAAHFLKKYEADAVGEIKGFEPMVIEAFMAHDWPGNVRELENVVHRALIAAGEEQWIRLRHLPAPLAELGRQKIHLGDAYIPVEDPDNDGIRPLKDVERDVIGRALVLTEGNLAKAAKSLRIGRATLYRKVKEYGLRDDN